MTTATNNTTLPATMRAWVYASTAGGLEKNLVLHEDYPLPKLSSRAGDAEVLLEMISASINPADYKVPELGVLARAVFRLPAVPGMDFCGRVVQTTPAAASKFAVGDKVFGRINSAQNGTCAQYFVAPASACAPLPPAGVTPDQGASFGVAGVTAYQAIAPNVKAGDKIFINGGSGGSGTFGIQIAKALGVHATVSCSTGKVELCRSLGADEVIDYTAVDIVKTLRAKGKTFALVVDNAGSPPELYKVADQFLLPGGKYVQVGAGATWAATKTLASRLLLPSFLGGGKSKFEFLLSGEGQEGLEQLAQWVVEGKVKPVIEEVYEFEDLPRAFTKLRGGRCTGKLVIHIGKQDS